MAACKIHTPRLTHDILSGGGLGPCSLLQHPLGHHESGRVYQVPATVVRLGPTQLVQDIPHILVVCGLDHAVSLVQDEVLEIVKTKVGIALETDSEYADYSYVDHHTFFLLMTKPPP